MHYIVFDLEFSQPPVKDQMILKPMAFYAEIIQIGAVKLNEQLQVVDTFDVLVKPRYYPHISARVERIIGLHHNGGNEKQPFPKACEQFLAFCGTDSVLFSWGSTDALLLEKNMMMYNLPTSAVPSIHDAQALYGKTVIGSQLQTGLQSAVKNFGKPEFVAHNALDDAMCAANILKELPLALEADEIAAYVLPRAEKKGKQELFFQKTFASRQAAFQRLQICKVVCACGKHLPLEGLFVLSKSKAIATANCECGKEYFIFGRFYKAGGGSVSLKMHRERMTPELRYFYESKKDVDDAIRRYAEKKKAERLQRKMARAQQEGARTIPPHAEQG